MEAKRFHLAQRWHVNKAWTILAGRIENRPGYTGGRTALGWMSRLSRSFTSKDSVAPKIRAAIVV
jgi:hypothetical protein